MLFQGLLGGVSALALYTPEADRKKKFYSEDACRFNHQVNILDDIHEYEDDIHNLTHPPITNH